MTKAAGIGADRRRGRGALSNETNRFERLVTEAIDDGWTRDDSLPPLRTEVADERMRRVITKNSSPDLAFDRSINPYRGCEHGCIYCFARPSHAYLGLSPGLDFETKLIARPNAPALLRKELSSKRYKPAVLAIGTNTDPYQPVEKTRLIMRDCLKILAEFRHPVAIVTKGSLIERDIDILSAMAADGLAAIGVSITTLDPKIARAMEPRVPHPARRLAVIERLSRAGIPVRVMASPIIPGLTDPELEAILEAGHAAGAVAASCIPLRLPLEVAPLFRAWIEEKFPLRAAKVMSRVRDLNGGQDYDPQWGRRMRGRGVYAKLIRDRFERSCRKLGLSEASVPLRCDLFHVPARAGDQLSLF